MKRIFTTLLLAGTTLAFLTAQTVTTITTSASRIDDDLIFDQAGNLYGSNYTGSAVYKRTPDGVESIFTNGLDSPNGLAFNSAGDLFVVDNTDNKIYKVAPDGSKEVFVPSIPGPSGILRMHDSDTLLVTSYIIDVVWKLAPDGSFSVYLTHPQFNGPVGLCYDDSLNLYVANFSDRRIFKVNPQGQITFFTQPPLGQYIGFIAYANGYIYATAMNSHKIYRIDLEGNYSVWLGTTAGSTDGDASVAKFNQPNGIRASSTGDTLYISDLGTRRVRMVTNLGGISGVKDELMPEWNLAVFPNPLNSDGQITFELSEATMINLELYDEQGRLVRSVLNAEKLSTGTHRYAISKSGLAPGIYFLQMQSGDGRLLSKKVAITE
mgnify:CR=1 FL=1